MNYISPSCMKRFGTFTPLQIERMETEFEKHRQGKRAARTGGVPTEIFACAKRIRQDGGFVDCGCLRDSVPARRCVARRTWALCDLPARQEEQDRYLIDVYSSYLRSCEESECADEVNSRECCLYRNKKKPRKACVDGHVKKRCPALGGKYKQKTTTWRKRANNVYDDWGRGTACASSSEG